jgi:ketosteroid isomerase-like protein
MNREVRMASAVSNKDVLLSIYAHRVRDDLEGTLDGFTEDVAFEFNGRGAGVASLASPAHGRAALRPIMRDLIENYHLTNWRVVSLLAEGDQVALHWRATVSFSATGKSAEFDVFDLATFRDGKISALHQTTDTAMIVAMRAG